MTDSGGANVHGGSNVHDATNDDGGTGANGRQPHTDGYGHG
jgi:hypothetical protein